VRYDYDGCCQHRKIVFQDRLGTNRASGARFRPYGDEITSTSQDREKFATYNRDGFSGLDYADQRYYASTYGRMNTPDPYQGSAGPKETGSWNRYAYVIGDRINSHDPTGLVPDEDESSDVETNGSDSGMINFDGLRDGDDTDDTPVFTATGTATADPDDGSDDTDSDSDPVVFHVTGTAKAPVGATQSVPCVKDVTPAQGQQIINNAVKFLGTPYGSGPGKLVCTGLACQAIKPLIPGFPEGRASGWGRHNNLRPLGPKEPPQVGDVIRYPGHVGLYDPSHAPNPVLSATSSRGVRWTPATPWFGQVLGFSRVQVPCK
jgi:RHS repeat-associated protein